jgi:hypothetical protein
MIVLRRATICLLLLSLLVITVAVENVTAQGGIATIESLTVTLMPQYDDPRLLMVYEATLASPGEVALGVPSGVELARASYHVEDGRLEDAEASFEAAPEGRFIHFNVPTNQARLDLYYDVITAGPERFVDFTLPRQKGAIAGVTWQAILPADATDITSSPGMALAGENHLGMPVYEREEGSIEEGERPFQNLAWVRASDAPFLLLPGDEAAEQNSGFINGLSRQSYIYLGGGLLFLVGLWLVVDGFRKQRRENQASSFE